jgi:hypothetical protein
MLCENYMHKGQEGVNVKMNYEFDTNLMKIMCLQQTKKMKVDHRIKILKLNRIVFFSQILIFCRTFFVMNFLCLSMHTFSFLHCGLQSLKDQGVI